MTEYSLEEQAVAEQGWRAQFAAMARKLDAAHDARAKAEAELDAAVQALGAVAMERDELIGAAEEAGLWSGEAAKWRDVVAALATEANAALLESVAHFINGYWPALNVGDAGMERRRELIQQRDALRALAVQLRAAAPK